MKDALTEKRRALTDLERAKLFRDEKGICHICTGKIMPGSPWQADHVKPLQFQGSNDLANYKPAHVACHQGKSAREAKERAKTDRIMKKRAGIKRKRPSFATNRDGPFRKRMDGTVERRGG